MSSVELFEGILRQWAASVPSVSRVWVFGSVAKGKLTPNDLDVAVELDVAEPAIFWMDHASEWQSKLKSLLTIKVQLEYFDPNGSTPTIAKGLSDAKFKRIPFEVLEAVGSKERWIEIIGRTRSNDKDIQRIQDREYMNLINICASLAKAQIERASPTAGQPMMVVQIIGREETPCDITISSLPQSVPTS